MEVVETEKSYLNNLKLLLSCFKQPLEKEGLLSKEESNVIFSNVETIINFSDTLLQRLLSRLPASLLSSSITGVMSQKKEGK